MGKAGLRLVPGEQIKREDLEQYFSMNGYTRASTVIEPGDYALRGSLVDVFPPGFDEPVRLDFFGDELETLRSFDADSQRSTTSHKRIDLAPVSEVFLNPVSIAKFRTSYIAAFGGGLSDDPVYAAVSQGIRYQGLEHWLPLFTDTVETLFDYVPDTSLWAFDALSTEAGVEREKLIADYFEARQGHAEEASAYKAIPPQRLYLMGAELEEKLSV